MNYLLIATLVFSAIQAKAETLPDPKTTSYLCTASYLSRKVVVISAKKSGRISNLETTVISSISNDFGNSISGGGGDIMDGKIELDTKEDVVLSNSQVLTDTKGRKLQAIGDFDNGYGTYKKDKISYEFNVQFYPLDTSAEGKNIGPEFHIKGEGSQIAEVKKNEFIQVSCNFVRRLKFK